MADDAFPLPQRVLKPYGDPGLTPAQIRFNYMMSRSRMVVECAFGHLAQSFGVLNLLRTKKRNTILTISTACHLYNFLTSHQT